MRDHIVIKGARENNLKNIDVEIPRDALVVMTGLSGSGKSSLAFDTIFAEGQRRYMESLSSYARQFLGQMDKPDVDSIDGMSPAISIDQKTTSKNPRSTVGTVTEIYDYLRLLWARVGVPHCPKCGKEIRRQTVDQIVDQIAALPQATRVQILAPVIRARKGEHQKVFDDARRGGYVRVRVDGSIYDLTETITLDKNRKHNIEIVVDRVVIRPDQNRRLTDAVEIASALSGGESQRIRLATQIGSSLMGVLYILDEPSIGLHQRDNEKLLATLRELRDLGNTLIVVEHDEDTMRAADYLIDIGPGAGVHGGEVVCAGTPEEVARCERSITGQYLSGKKKIPVPAQRRTGNGHALVIRGASEHNLKHVDVQIPLGVMTCVTGVSGSGKSSLVNEVLYKTLAGRLNHAKLRPGKCDGIDGVEYLDKIINIDQSPIGRTPRSNPATYTGLFDDIRSLFASTQDAKLRGYSAGRFSFNIRGGRCEACSGDGLLKIEMNFLPDVYVPCEVCKGKRYNRETLEVHYKGKNIAEVLDMTVEEALAFFQNQPKIRDRLQTLMDVGLGYVRLGQPSTTLSGGEAQRIKLATELSKRSTGRTIYVLDEPTTGLHVADVARLIDILNRLTDAGNTVLVIEHNLHVIKVADHIIDLGPEGGDAGGSIVFTGTPEDCARCAESYTGQFLKKELEG